MSRSHGGAGVAAAFESLRGNRPFQLLWTSNLFFFGGVWTQTLVLGWLAFELTQSTFLVAVYTAARLAPLLLGPLSGALADRFDRVKLLWVACAWATVGVGLVAALATAGMLPFWGVVVAGLAIGLAQSPSQPARASLVMTLVGPKKISNANALNALAMNVTQVIGPALGGLMIVAVGAAGALWISSAWYLVSLGLILPLGRLRLDAHRSAPADRPRTSVWAMTASGLRYAARHPRVRAVLLVTVAANALIWPIFQSFMPVFAEDSLGLDAGGLGILLTSCGVGGLVGALVIAAMGDFRGKGIVFAGGTALWSLLWSVFALVYAPLVAFAVMAAVGVFSATFAVLQTTLVLLAADTEYHGRVLGLQELAIGTMPLTTIALGAIAEWVGLNPTVFVAGIVLVALIGLIVLGTPSMLTIGDEPRHPRVRRPRGRHGADDAASPDAAGAAGPVAPVGSLRERMPR